MPKIKTHKTAAKRFKTTGSGKLLRRRTSVSHKLTDKSAGRKRRLSGTVDVTRGDGKRIKRMLAI